jgi:hypothetical protein
MRFSEWQEKPWWCIPADIDVHVVPEVSTEAVPHVLERDCWCGPGLIDQNAITGGFVVSHHETKETGN